MIVKLPILSLGHRQAQPVLYRMKRRSTAQNGRCCTSCSTQHVLSACCTAAAAKSKPSDDKCCCYQYDKHTARSEPLSHAARLAPDGWKRCSSAYTVPPIPATGAGCTAKLVAAAAAANPSLSRTLSTISKPDVSW
jgi:hypothetical protein